jgi:hypothetical protein
VHAHTGVMSHLMAPLDARMVARSGCRAPSQAGNRVELGAGNAGKSSVDAG